MERRRPSDGIHPRTTSGSKISTFLGTSLALWRGPVRSHHGLMYRIAHPDDAIVKVKVGIGNLRPR